MAEKKKSREPVMREKTEHFFSKEQILSSERFQDKRDIVDALLLPDTRYTVFGVEEMISEYMKGKVK